MIFRKFRFIHEKIQYAGVVKLAYTIDFDCVTTVHLIPAAVGR